MIALVKGKLLKAITEDKDEFTFPIPEMQRRISIFFILPFKKESFLIVISDLSLNSFNNNSHSIFVAKKNLSTYLASISFNLSSKSLMR